MTQSVGTIITVVLLRQFQYPAIDEALRALIYGPNFHLLKKNILLYHRVGLRLEDTIHGNTNVFGVFAGKHFQDL